MLAATGLLLLAACGQSGTEWATSTASATTPVPTTGPVASPLVVGGPGRYEAEVLSAGLRRRFVLVVPESVSSPAPLVLVFHGFAGSPRAVEELSAMTELAEAEGFLVVYPEGAGLPRRWRADPRQGGLDVAFVRDLVAAVGEAIPVDRARVYAAGMSNGGGMAARLGCDAADLVAAVGAVAGAYNSAACSPTRPVPVIAFHGTADPIVPYEGWRPLLPAIEPWAAGWAERDGCDTDPGRERVAPDVVLTSWDGCDGGARVFLYTVEGGRHGWPGAGSETGWSASTDSVDASALLLEFFAAHPLP